MEQYYKVFLACLFVHKAVKTSIWNVDQSNIN